jgi:hypothetical protein
MSNDCIVIFVVKALRHVQLVTTHCQESALKLVAGCQRIELGKGFNEIDVPKTINKNYVLGKYLPDIVPVFRSYHD